jgi:hypothetical protein
MTKKTSQSASPTVESSTVEQGAYSVNGFCVAHNIGKGLFYELLKQGNGPDTIKLGRRRIITKQASARWREKMEQQTAQLASA